ncbi:nitric oxide-associated protein 1-like [Leucoraja erinacea]|uniref:nitric oxide-associated protein 1-like n=1 Tax=Leucoraja erinaceus TaxID=7782 RepID=UPI0024588F36|nr:nitric oxide-associated protein 1-like [Leucoraja erinacea]
MARAVVRWLLRRALAVPARAPFRGAAAGTGYTAVEPGKPEEMAFVEYAAAPEEEEEAAAAEITAQQRALSAQAAPVASEQTSAALGALRRQLHAMEALKPTRGAEVTRAVRGAEPLVTDPGFPAPELPSRKKRRRRLAGGEETAADDERGGHRVFGTADPLVPASDCPCSGCGALLHCAEPSLPGYLPSEKFKQLSEAGPGAMRRAVCQRCFLLVHHQKALEVQVPLAEYQRLVGSIARHKALVLYMLDLIDLSGGSELIPSLVPLLGQRNTVLVLANKTDLVPADHPSYLQRLRHRVLELCSQAGLWTEPCSRGDVHLISAKTGYGIEKLISHLQSTWRYKGDVYLVGGTNVGKSTLFNTLLQSDYCKSKASDVIQRATVSRWPGTTLNLLKFPIINPTPHRMFRRLERLKADKSQSEDDLIEEELKNLQLLKKHGYLIGRVGRTFRNTTVSKGCNNGIIEWDPDKLALSPEPEDVNQENVSNTQDLVEFTYNEIKDARWFYDTPGIIKQDCILNLLTSQELKVVMPYSGIIPRTYVLQPGMVMFLGALGRIDFLKGEKSAWFSVVASNKIPVHITSLEKADSIYECHAGKTLLGVPIGDDERMKKFPPLVSQDIELDGIGTLEAVADIKFSSAGWIAVTAHSNDRIHLRAYIPAGIGLMVEKPPLLPFIVGVKGERIKKSAAYKLKKQLPFVQNITTHTKIAKM